MRKLLSSANLPATRRAFLAVAASGTVVLLAACSGNPPATDTGSASRPQPSMPGSGSSTSPAASPSTNPSAEAAVKELVAGFPSKVLPLMKGAQIQASSIEKGAQASVASLTATITATPEAVLDYYGKHLGGLGFKAQEGDKVDGVPLKTFVRADGKEIVTVSVVQTGSTATFSLGATLLPASFN